MCLCVCACVHVCMHVRGYTHVPERACACVCVRVCVHLCVCVLMRLYQLTVLPRVFSRLQWSLCVIQRRASGILMRPCVGPAGPRCLMGRRCLRACTCCGRWDTAGGRRLDGNEVQPLWDQPSTVLTEPTRPETQTLWLCERNGRDEGLRFVDKN